jgi:hypothetical protein
MSDTRDIQAVMQQAEQAAAAGDFPTAEQLLSEAAAMQERTLGPRHQDLANTLNNLAIVRENLGRTDAAEQAYRRAYAIAKASLPADHPFVATSRQNLADFCQARGIAFEPPAPPPLSPTPPPTVVSTAPASPRADREGSREPSTRPAPAQTSPAHPQAPAGLARAATPATPVVASAPALSRGLVPAAAVIAILLMGFVAFRWGRTPDAPPAPQASPATVRAAPTASAIPPPPAPTPAPPAPESKATVEPPPTPPPAAPPPAKATRSAAASSVKVEASICRSLTTGPGAWRCQPPGSPVSAGPLVLYTRVISPRDTTVEHRWYQGTTLRQAVQLEAGANLSPGYRTYSRHTVSTPGEWRLEVRTLDGEVLYEERFTVK